MNRTYRTVFNDSTGQWQAVTETAKGRCKGGRKAITCMTLATLALAAPLAALAGGSGGNGGGNSSVFALATGGDGGAGGDGTNSNANGAAGGVAGGGGAGIGGGAPGVDGSSVSGNNDSGSGGGGGNTVDGATTAGSGGSVGVSPGNGGRGGAGGGVGANGTGGGIACCTSGGGGGGGGGGDGAISTGGSITNPLTGGAGGAGNGNGIDFAGGGGGGGGAGLVVTSSGTSPTTTIQGVSVNGGAGGSGGTDSAYGGGGGGGGAGIAFTASGLTLDNTGSITGGAGGVGGSGGTANGNPGAGGAGVIGSGLTLINNGSISGGLSGDGTTQANAITFTGGANTLTLNNGSTLTGNIAVGGAGSLNFNQTSDYTLSNIITGSGSVIKSGTGILTLAGTNLYTGATTINAGTLALSGSGSIEGSAGVVLSSGATFDITNATSTVTLYGLSGSGGTVALGNTNLTLSLANDSTYSGSFTGSGSLSKSDAGTLILNGNSSSYGGTVNVAQGTLEVGDASNSSAVLGNSSSTVMVDEAGTLRGHGTIGGSVENTGTVAPGGTIGTLTVNGNYTQNVPGSPGTLSIEVSPTSASLLNVLGTATLGGTLALIYDPGTYSAKQYTIVSSGGGLGGTTFASVSSTNQSAIGSLTPAVSYSANDVYLTLTGNNAPVVIAPQDISIYSAVGTTALQGEQAMGIALLDRSNAPDSGTPWATFTGTYARLDGTGSTPGFITQRYGVLAGEDRAVGDGTAGIVIGYDHANVNEQTTGDSGMVDAIRIALYGNRMAGQVRLSGTMGVGLDALSQKRPFGTLGTAQGDHLGQELNLGTQASLPMDIKGITVAPHVGLRYAGFHANGFGESGAGGQDLNVGTDTINSLQSDVGMVLSKRFGTDDKPIDVQLKANYARELLDTNRALGVNSQDGTPFTAAGVSLPREYLTAGVGVTLHTAKNIDVSLRYDTLFNTAHAEAQQGRVNVAYRF